MYTSNQLIRALKSLAEADTAQSDQGHCQRLHYHARRLGFQSFEHYRRWVKSAPQESLGNLSTKLMERVCATRLPSLEAPYVELTPVPDGMSYYSYWVGWDSHGNEVRVPRPLDAQHSIPRLRKLVDYPIYVVESARELLAWQYQWKSAAYLPEELARQFFPSLWKDQQVDPNVSSDLVRQRAAARRGTLR